MKKIIFVCRKFEIGGVETSFRNLLLYGIDKSKFQVELHLLNQSAKLDYLIEENCHCVSVDSHYELFFKKKTIKDAFYIIKKYGLKHWIQRAIISLLLLLKINKIYWLGGIFFPKVKKSTCDVCVVLKENDPCLYYALSKIKAKKVVSFFHTANYFSQIYAYLYESSKVNHVITVSQGNREFLLRKMPKLSDKITVIHNIISPKEIKEKSRQIINEKFDDNVYNLVSVGRICVTKGIETIISAASILRNRKLNFRWHLVGPFDQQYTREKFENDIRQNNVEDIFNLIGPTDNPYPFIRSSDILINPSLIESYGMVIREAQILGIPVIATNTYGGNELIVDGKSGLLVNINNAKELAEKVFLLLSDKSLYYKIKQNLENDDFDNSKSVMVLFDNVIDC